MVPRVSGLGSRFALLSLLFVLVSWCAPSRAQDVMGIKIGDSPEQVKKVLESVGGYQVSVSPEVGSLQPFFGNWTSSINASRYGKDGSRSNIRVLLTPPPTVGVMEVSLGESYSSQGRPQYPVVLEALKKKYGDNPTTSGFAGRSAGAAWGFADGKAIPLPADYSSCTANPFQSKIIGEASKQAFDAEVSKHARKSCPRLVSASVRYASGGGEIVEIFGVSLNDSNYARNAAVKTRAIVDGKNASERQSELDKSKGVAAPKF